MANTKKKKIRVKKSKKSKKMKGGSSDLDYSFLENSDTDCLPTSYDNTFIDGIKEKFNVRGLFDSAKIGEGDSDMNRNPMPQMPDCSIL
jgi:hypothetical protein